MSDYQASTTLRYGQATSPALRTLAAEVSAFLNAIVQPGALQREVEDMGRLLREARRVEASDPQRSAQLMRQASRACA